MSTTNTMDKATADSGITFHHGNPTPAEVAAITALLYSLAQVQEEPDAKAAAKAWNNPGLRLNKRRSWRQAAIPSRKGTDR